MATKEPTKATSSRTLQLEPLATQITAEPSAVCEALLRLTRGSEGLVSWDGNSKRMVPGKWFAKRGFSSNEITLLMEQGPLSFMQLAFVAEAAPGATTLKIKTEYNVRNPQLAGIFERWQAKREATALRDGVLHSLTQSLAPDASEPRAELRQAQRHTVRALARLYVSSQDWRGEVLDVSERGLGMVVYTQSGKAEEDLKLLHIQASGEMELLLPGARLRAHIVVTRAMVRRGGIEVGLFMPNEAEAHPFVQAVLSRTRVALTPSRAAPGDTTN